MLANCINIEVTHWEICAITKNLPSSPGFIAFVEWIPLKICHSVEPMKFSLLVI